MTAGQEEYYYLLDEGARRVQHPPETRWEKLSVYSNFLCDLVCNNPDFNNDQDTIENNVFQFTVFNYKNFNKKHKNTNEIPEDPHCKASIQHSA